MSVYVAYSKPFIFDKYQGNVLTIQCIAQLSDPHIFLDRNGYEDPNECRLDLETVRHPQPQIAENLRNHNLLTQC